MKKENVIYEKAFNFATEIVEICKKLFDEQKELTFICFGLGALIVNCKLNLS